MKINFIPQEEGMEKDLAELEDIWNTYGDKIVQLLEKYSGFNFIQQERDCLLIRGKSMSMPLSLKYNLPYLIKISTLMHELGHVILMKRIEGFKERSMEEKHAVLFCFLMKCYETFENETGIPGFYKSALDRESFVGYGPIWDWTYTHQDEYQKIIAGDFSVFDLHPVPAKVEKPIQESPKLI